MHKRNDIIIIGGGFSGTMLAIQLHLQNEELPLKIRIVENRATVSHGIAYSTDKDFHLLNVRAGRMSAFPNKPDHFVQWLEENKIPLSASGHMPRKIYGRYLKDLLDSILKAHSSYTDIEIIRDEATDLEIENRKVQVMLQSGKSIQADKVALALGNYSPAALSIFSDEPPLNYCPDPWTCNYLDRIKSNDTVLIVGTGLTMVDTCMSLSDNLHKGKIICLSTHGYIPFADSVNGPYPAFYDELKDEKSVLKIYAVIKKHIANALNRGIDWRSVVDSLRPYTASIWNLLPEKEKGIFMKHLYRIWNVSRHRIPPASDEVIWSMKRSGQLKIIAGKLTRVQSANKALNLEYTTKSSRRPENISADFVINCTGPQMNYQKIAHPLVQNLLEKNYIYPGPLNIGIDAQADGKILSERSGGTLYTLGPPLTGVLMESTAVPEIRKQAHSLAQKIIYDLKRIQQQVNQN